MMWRTATLGQIAAAVLIFTGCILSVGCGAETGDNSEWTYGDAGTDGSTQQNPTATTFRLENDTDSPIRIQKNEACDSPPGWVGLEDESGTVQVTSGACPNCTCKEAENGECDPCAGTGACRAPVVAELESGASTEWEWAGYSYTQRQVNGQQCIDREIPETGKSFTATFCWSTDPGPSGPGAELSDETCETVEFEYGNKTVVEAVVDGEVADPQPTKFVLKNGTENELETHSFTSCDVPEYPWVSIHETMPERGQPTLRFDTDCTSCNCSDVRSGQCGVCAMPCRQSEIERFEAGAKRTYDFDGIAWKRREVDGVTCDERVDFSPDQRLYARFCWNYPLADSEPFCEVKEFQYGDEAVVHTIRPNE